MNDELATQVHRIFYDEEDGRQTWECTTCSAGGSVGEFGDVELAAERNHEKAYGPDVQMGTTSRRPW